MKKILFSICLLLFFTMQSIAQDTTRSDNKQSEQREDVSENPQNPQQQYDDLRKWGLSSICGILSIILIVSVIVYRKVKGRDEIVEIVLKSRRIAEAFAPPQNYPPQNSAKTGQLTEREINLIVDRVLECLTLNEKETKPSSQSSESNGGFIPPRTVYKYLKGKTGKIFNRVDNTPDNSFFRLSNEYGDIADFEFYGNEEEAIAKRIFHEDICNILSGNYQNAHSVQIITPGKVKRIGEQWSVIEPMKIILI